ncbi:MAG: SMI1/KNR4 family protein [Planctomycetota bacterium]|jgi:hypothetical protein
MGVEIDLDYVAEALGVELPEEYIDFAQSLAESGVEPPILNGMLETDAEQIISLNERLWFAIPLAGLNQWPADYLVIGDDGCGNYFIADDSQDTVPVLFYDHEADSISRCADSLEDFATRIRHGHPLDDSVVHSGCQARKQKAREASRGPTKVELADDAPPWATDWNDFAEVFLDIVSKRLSPQKQTVALNREFGGKPVCWVGTLTDLCLGEYKSATIQMPNCPSFQRHDDGLSSVSVISVGLRTEEEDYEHVETLSPEIRTTLAAWKEASVGDRIRFQLMFSPGYEDRIACIDVKSLSSSRRSFASIKTCGAHLLEVVHDS